MPLLPLEPFIFPPDLFTTPLPAGENGAHWLALHTRPRAEKSIARRFLQRNLSFFLPLYHKQWRSRGRMLQSHLPLFPGYVFLHGDDQSRLAALETNLVARTLTVEDQQQLHQDLSRVHHLMVAGVSLSPESRLMPGTLVEITSGPLTGLTGKVLRRGKQMKIFVEVQFLQRGVSVEMESWTIKPLA